MLGSRSWELESRVYLEGAGAVSKKYKEPEQEPEPANEIYKTAPGSQAFIRVSRKLRAGEKRYRLRTLVSVKEHVQCSRVKYGNN